MRSAAALLLLLAACGGTPALRQSSHSASGSGSGSTGGTLHPITGTTSSGSSGGSTSTSGSGSTGSSSSTSASSASASATSTSSSGSSASASSSSGSTGTSSTSSSSSSSGSTSTSTTTTTTGGSTGSVGAALGAPCSGNGDCASGSCGGVLLGGGKVCVASCTSQADCDAIAPGFFCEPISAGDSNGLCVPPSAAHCAACATDADCGSLAEACVQAPSDTGPACHVDCSIAGAAACPSDYVCAAVDVGGSPRQLCVPNAGGCATALGGFCDRVPGPLPCAVANAAGTCSGQRSCDTSSQRFGLCNAGTPSCRPTCATAMDPGCTESYCASATSGPDNCGSCGNVCQGYGQSTAVVSCVSGTTCTFACAGGNYDTNGNPADGCEQPDLDDDHDRSTATELGNSTCHDGDGIPPNGGGPTGTIASDARLHVPAINAFASSVGAAPDFFHTYNTGGACYDDFSIKLTVYGSAYPNCYKLTVITDVSTWAQNTDASGSTTITAGSGSYTDGSDIYLVAEKVCSTAQLEAVTYSITGHF